MQENLAKKDIHHIEQNFDAFLKSIDRDFSPENAKLVKRFIDDCLIGKNMSKKVGKSKIMRYVNDLKIFSKYCKKSFKSVTEKDIEQFYRDLANNRIKKQDNSDYSVETKNGFITCLKKIGKWFYKGNIAKFDKIFAWQKKFAEQKEIPALARAEIERMVSVGSLQEYHTIRDNCLVMFGFDSGVRAEELLNIRLLDLNRKDDSNGKGHYYSVRIRYSKTKPRTISVPLCTKYIDDYMQIHKSKDNPEAFLFDIDYDNLRRILRRKGKILNKRVYPHLLRHSSATYYANILKNLFKLCYRYGWTMGSDMAQRYIDREGLLEEETANDVRIDETDKLVKQNQKQQEEINLLKSEFNVVSDDMRKIKNAFALMSKLQELKATRKHISENDLRQVVLELSKNGEIEDGIKKS